MDVDYTKAPMLKHIFLEDSWIRKITETDSEIIFNLEAVLTDKHPDYLLPKQGEQYCYKNALLTFNAITSKVWQQRNNGTRDANDEIDYGHIDVLGRTNDGFYIEGDFGVLEITTANPPTFVLK